MERELLVRYLTQAHDLERDLQGLDRPDLIAFPVPGMMSIAQVAWHMIDTDLVLADRMRRVIAMDEPPIVAFDENRYTERLHYQDRDPISGCELFRLNRVTMSSLLQRLPPETFARAGIHNEAGRITLADLLTKSITHFDHHRKFLHEKRAKLGKPV
ncbi:MAG: DinB family protein [Pirellulales bacterium]